MLRPGVIPCKHFPPQELFRRIAPYTDPLEFIRNDEDFATLKSGFTDDMFRAGDANAELATARHAFYFLPAEPWAGRVSGVLVNDLAGGADHAHSLLTLGWVRIDHQPKTSLVR